MNQNVNYRYAPNDSLIVSAVINNIFEETAYRQPVRTRFQNSRETSKYANLILRRELDRCILGRHFVMHMTQNVKKWSLIFSPLPRHSSPGACRAIVSTEALKDKS